MTAVHGIVRQDDWHWLRERDDPAVKAYLEAENAYTEARGAPIRALADRLFVEMKARWKETDLSVPYRKGRWLYYTRTVEGLDYAIHARRRGSMEAPEQILVDGNALAEGRPYFDLGDLAVSPDERFLAYSVDFDGDERYEIRVRDLVDGRECIDRIEDTAGAFEWAADSRTLFYPRLDETMRPYRLFRHALGERPAADRLLYEETDERFFLDVSKTRSERFLRLELHSTTSSEVHVLEADRPQEDFRVVEPRRPDVEYEVEHHGDRFFVVTNDEAIDFRLMEAPTDAPGRAHWVERIPHRPGTYLLGVDAFRHHLVVHERRDGLPALRIDDLRTGQSHDIGFEEPAYSIEAAANPEFDSPTFRFVYTSLVTPRTVFDYDMTTRARTVLKRQEVLGDYDPTRFEARREHAVTADGARVPISIVHRRDLSRAEPHPTLLYGYGAYGIPIEAAFGSARLSLLERGVVFAMAHVRGGSELGRSWYDDGKLERKENSFADLVACAEHLVGSGATTADRLALMGGSAGGLLVGAVLNRRPDLFRAAVTQVPFVDVLNTMLDPNLPLTVHEYEQWGDPNDRAAFERIRGWCPYENVRATRYPDLFVTAGLHDPRVQYWEAAKWVAKLRHVADPEGLVLLKVNLEAGHQGASGRYDALRETALEYAFLLDRLGLSREEPRR